MSIRELVPDFDTTTIIYLGAQLVILFLVAVFLSRMFSKSKASEKANDEQQLAATAALQRELEFFQRAEEHMKRVEEKLDHIVGLLSDR